MKICCRRRSSLFSPTRPHASSRRRPWRISRRGRRSRLLKFKVYWCSRCAKVFWSPHDVEGHKTSHQRGAALTPVAASEDAAIPSWPQEIKRTRYYFPLSEWKALKRITPDRQPSSARIDEQD
ncbi:unnamed protein product [Musa textilis]